MNDAERDGTEEIVRRLFTRRSAWRPPPGFEEGDGGMKVPIPTGPRPRIGGAEAQPPEVEEEAWDPTVPLEGR